MKTLPALAREWELNREALRSFIRRRPELKQLGQFLGRARGYSPAEASQIREAFENRPAALKT